MSAIPSGAVNVLQAMSAPPRSEAPDDLDAINKLYRERRWSDGLPVVPPPAARVDRMLRCARRARDEIVARVAPGFGAATIERIAINAVLAGCDAEYLPVLIAAVDAVAAPEFNLQGIQATTNPVAIWIIVNGPVRAGSKSTARSIASVKARGPTHHRPRAAAHIAQRRRRAAGANGPRNQGSPANHVLRAENEDAIRGSLCTWADLRPTAAP
jgi:hypothetical protein